MSAVHGLYESDWRSDRTFSENLREARRSKGFPRHARVVAWGLESRASDDVATHAALAPLIDAGFIVESVVAPAEALARVAQQRFRGAERPGAAWLSLNRQGAAIAVVHGGRLLYSREFDWNYRTAKTLKEELLQRYSLVAHLAPEVRHGIDVVRKELGVVIDTVVTCGDLPDLRSLTMPLIEELDIEVETLDTLDGLTIESPARVEEVAERASAMRLACAAATVQSAAPITLVRRWLPVAAAALVVLTMAVWAAMQSRGRAVANRETSSGAAVTRDAQLPPTNVPAATSGQRDTRSGVTGGFTPALPRTQPAPAASSERRPTGSAAASAPRDVEPAQRRRGVVEKPIARVPLRDPLPVVNSILVSPDRRLAVVDGEIVREGEPVGRRVLIRIEPGALVLREPSGHEVRVPIRRKFEPDQ